MSSADVSNLYRAHQVSHIRYIYFRLMTVLLDDQCLPYKFRGPSTTIFYSGQHITQQFLSNHSLILTSDSETYSHYATQSRDVDSKAHQLRLKFCISAYKIG